MLEHPVQHLISEVETILNHFSGIQENFLQVLETNKDKMYWVDISGDRSEVKR